MIANEDIEIGVDANIKIDVLVNNNRGDIFIYDKKRNKITLYK